MWPRVLISSEFRPQSRERENRNKKKKSSSSSSFVIFFLSFISSLCCILLFTLSVPHHRLRRPRSIHNGYIGRQQQQQHRRVVVIWYTAARRTDSIGPDMIYSINVLTPLSTAIIILVVNKHNICQHSTVLYLAIFDSPYSIYSWANMFYY